MNYRNFNYRAIKEFLDLHSGYSTPEMLYSIIRAANIRQTKELLNLSEQDLYQAIKKATENENETYA